MASRIRDWVRKITTKKDENPTSSSLPQSISIDMLKEKFDVEKQINETLNTALSTSSSSTSRSSGSSGSTSSSSTSRSSGSSGSRNTSNIQTEGGFSSAEPITPPTTTNLLNVRQTPIDVLTQQYDINNQIRQRLNQGQSIAPQKTTIPSSTSQVKSGGAKITTIGVYDPKTKYYQTEFDTGSLGQLVSREEPTGTIQGPSTRQAFAGYDPRTGEAIYTTVNQPGGKFIPTLAEQESLRETFSKIYVQEYEDKLTSEIEKDITNKADSLTNKYQKLVNSNELSIDQATQLLEQDLNEYQNNLLDSKKYKDLEKSYNKKVEGVGGFEPSPAFTQAITQDLRTTKQKILENIPVIGSGSRALESWREYVRTSGGVGYVEGVGRLKNPGEGRALGGALVDTAFFAGDLALTGSLAKTGLRAGATKIEQELAKRTSQSLDDLARSRITGIQIVKENGEFVMKGSQNVGNFARKFAVKGKLVKVGNSYSFIPSSSGRSVVVGITKANLKGISGKTLQTISKISGKGTSELFIMPETFNLGGSAVERQVPYSLRGMSLSKTKGFGVYNPEVQSFARLRKPTTANLQKQLSENIKFGGDPLVSSLSSLKISGKGGKASLSISKESDILSLVYSQKSKTNALDNVLTGGKLTKKPPILTKKPPIKNRLQKVDDILTGGKTTMKTTSKNIQVDQNIMKNLQEGFIGSQPRLVKPFTFSTRQASLGRQALTSIIGLFGVRTAQRTMPQQKVSSANIQKSLISQAQRQIQTSKLTKSLISKQGLKTQGVSLNIPQAPLSFGIGGIGRPFGISGLRRISSSGSGGIRRSVPTKRKRKDTYVLSETGFGLITGRKAVKRKKLSDITGFEALR